MSPGILTGSDGPIATEPDNIAEAQASGRD